MNASRSIELEEGQARAILCAFAIVEDEGGYDPITPRGFDYSFEEFAAVRAIAAAFPELVAEFAPQLSSAKAAAGP